MRSLFVTLSVTVLVLAVADAPAFSQSMFLEATIQSPESAPPDTSRKPTEEAATQKPGSGFSRFFRDVGSDYKHFVSLDTAKWLAIGGGAALATHPLDDDIREEAAEPPRAVERALEGGDRYGNLTYQTPLAVAWWIIGHAAGSAKSSAAGRDLLRAQISAASWTYAAKVIANRDRPNGDPRSFPSGHSSATFATATVLQRHYGWKVGVPFYALATYTGVSRIIDDKHWASDVVFGAFMGMTAGRTVTVHLRSHALHLAPVPAPGGGMLSVTVQ